MGSDQPSQTRFRIDSGIAPGCMEAADLGKQDVFITTKQAPRKLCTLEHSAAAHAHPGRLPATVPGITDQTLGLPTSGHGAKVDSQNMAVRDMGIHGTEPLRRPVRFNLHMSGAAAVVRYVEHRWRSGAGRLVFSCDASAPPRQPPRAKQVLMPQC